MIVSVSASITHPDGGIVCFSGSIELVDFQREKVLTSRKRVNCERFYHQESEK